VWDRVWQGWEAVVWLPVESSSPGAQHDLKKHEQTALARVQEGTKIRPSRDSTDRQALYGLCHL